jgi:hypothetical protein
MTILNKGGSDKEKEGSGTTNGCLTTTATNCSASESSLGEYLRTAEVSESNLRTAEVSLSNLRTAEVSR